MKPYFKICESATKCRLAVNWCYKFIVLNIKFTSEIEGIGSLSFLDITITRRNNKFIPKCRKYFIDNLPKQN